MLSEGVSVKNLFKISVVLCLVYPNAYLLLFLCLEEYGYM